MPHGNAVNIRQCIPADRDKASTFLEGLPQKPRAIASPFVLALSLIASEEEQTQGVALCYPVEGTQTHELFVAASPDEASLLQELVDKSLTKLHSQGIHKCKVTLIQSSEPHPIWNQSRWAGTMSEPAAPVAAKSKAKKAPKARKAAAAAA